MTQGSANQSCFRDRRFRGRNGRYRQTAWKPAATYSLDKGFCATGSVQLLGARILGSLNCSGGHFENKGGRAIAADGAVVGVSVFLNKLHDSPDSFLASGTVQLTGIRIAGQLECSSGRFNAPGGQALIADGAEIGAGVFLTKPTRCVPGFSASGEVRLAGTRVGGQLNCTGGRFDNPGDFSLVADGVEVQGDVNLGSGLHATGEVRLPGSQIAGQLTCSGGRFENPGGVAIGADQANVQNGAKLDQGFHATGQVRLLGARIGGQLNCTGAAFENPGNYALILQEASAESLWLRDLSPKTAGLIDLTEANVRLLVDDFGIQGLSGVLLRLDGFAYDRIAQSAPRSVKTRLGWLDLQGPGYFPQPYDQLAAVFRREGREHEARDLLVAKLRRRRETLPSLWSRCWDWFLDKSLLYGLQTWRPLLVGSTILLLAFSLVSGAQAAGLVVGPSDVASPFYPFTLVVDVFLWNVDLGAESRWSIDIDRGGIFAWLVTGFLWILKLVGWGTITLALAGRSRIFKRD